MQLTITAAKTQLLEVAQYKKQKLLKQCQKMTKSEHVWLHNTVILLVSWNEHSPILLKKIYLEIFYYLLIRIEIKNIFWNTERNWTKLTTIVTSRNCNRSYIKYTSFSLALFIQQHSLPSFPFRPKLLANISIFCRTPISRGSSSFWLFSWLRKRV